MTKEGIKNFFKKSNKIINQTLFPLTNTCNLCGREIFSGELFCDDCKATIFENNREICLNCGRKTPNYTSKCFSCNDGWAVDFARSAYLYSDGIEALIKNFKYYGKRYIGDIFIDKLSELYLKSGFVCDLVTFVPSTSEVMFDRGFNQSQYLAKGLAKKIDKPLFKLFVKKQETAHQAGLSLKQRRENLKNVFLLIDKSQVVGKKILIVDDVLTAGITSGELATILKKAGAEKVSLITVASVERQL